MADETPSPTQAEVDATMHPGQSQPAPEPKPVEHPNPEQKPAAPYESRDLHPSRRGRYGTRSFQAGGDEESHPLTESHPASE